MYIASIYRRIILKRPTKVLSTIFSEIHIERRNNEVVAYLRMRKSRKIIKIHLCTCKFFDHVSNIIFKIVMDGETSVSLNSHLGVQYYLHINILHCFTHIVLSSLAKMSLRLNKLFTQLLL